MAIGFDLKGDFTARDARAAGAGPLGTIGLSRVSGFATVVGKPRGRVTVKKLMLMAALVAYASPALAGSFVSTWSCRYSRYYGYSNCRTTSTKIPDPVRDLEQERLDAIELHKEDAKWEAFCKPAYTADEYGVRHASYATKGCEFGQSE
jgi:hypothetical protein